MINAVDRTEIIEKWDRDLMRYLIPFTENKTWAEDLKQDTWYEFLRDYGEGFILDENKSLIMEIARNNYLNFAKRKDLFEPPNDDDEPSDEGEFIERLDRQIDAEKRIIDLIKREDNEEQ
jgi:DNA-directed RNA polymerase specialized sigma24 family protein